MLQRNHRLVPLAALLVLLSACERATAPEPAGPAASTQISRAYEARSLGTLGGNFSLALGASEFAIVGVSSTSGGSDRAFAVSNGRMRAIGNESETSSAWAVNRLRSITLTYGPSGSERAVLLAGGMERPLGSLGGAATRPLALNDRNAVVGWSNVLGGARHAFLWTSRDGMLDLGTLPGTISSEATGVNYVGTVVGVSGEMGVSERAFQWTARDGMSDLDTFGGSYAAAFAISDRGVIVGYAATAAEEQHAALWLGKDTKDLGTLGGLYSAATAVNERDQIVGYSDTAEGATHAFLWTLSTGMIDLGTLPGGTFAVATAIQDNGRIAGYGDDASGALRAIEWTR